MDQTALLLEEEVILAEALQVGILVKQACPVMLPLQISHQVAEELALIRRVVMELQASVV